MPSVAHGSSMRLRLDVSSAGHRESVWCEICGVVKAGGHAVDFGELRNGRRREEHSRVKLEGQSAPPWGVQYAVRWIV